MTNDIGKLLDEYCKWLRSETTFREINNYIEITTPFLDRHNDYLQIFARRSNEGFILTDGGYILEDLELSGCRIDTPKRRTLLKTTLDGFGIQNNDKAFEVETSSDNFAIKKHNLLQAMLAVNDLFYLVSPIVASLFREDVAAWLNLSQIRYTPEPSFKGKSGFNHSFDFVIPSSHTKPERILRAINRPDRTSAEAMAFAWLDTKENRDPESHAYAILNDSEGSISDSTLSAMRKYDIQTVLWSIREEVEEEFAA